MTTAIAPRRLWFGLIGAPAAWIFQGTVGWGVGARICTELSIAAVRWTLGIFSLAMLAVALGGLAVGLSNWRTATVHAHAAGDRVEFMAFAGLLVSAVFTLAICWAGLNAIFINTCGGMR